MNAFKEILCYTIIILTSVIVTKIIDIPREARKATVYLKCPYSSYTIVSQEIKDRADNIFKLDKKNNSDVFAGADGLFYSAKYVSKDIIDIEAIGNQYMDNIRIFKVNLKED